MDSSTREVIAMALFGVGEGDMMLVIKSEENFKEAEKSLPMAFLFNSQHPDFMPDLLVFSDIDLDALGLGELNLWLQAAAELINALSAEWDEIPVFGIEATPFQ